ncbi:hypothetical protein FNU76_10220 [Chitinimonas arctica]|uniref:Uncharacterized protein n=1 Tax=Chitinimonas arctica TaxID=2594795 RepID=A0A516SEW8_9NEIS|nr:hypothetical protein [Chitinimonas arctica]QDQ26709.1 hypothetical protein FNU76_10220 [Chitinimonas arctica]
MVLINDLVRSLQMEKRSFSGRLDAHGLSVEISFSVSINDSGDLVLDFECIPSSEMAAAIKDNHGEETCYFSISGNSDERIFFKTESLQLTTFYESLCGGGLKIFGECEDAELVEKLPSSVEFPILRMYLKGLDGKNSYESKCIAGLLKVCSKGKVSCVNSIAGFIEVRAAADILDVDEWRKQAMSVLEYVQCALSFSFASFLRAPIIEFHGEGLLRIDLLSQPQQIKSACPVFENKCQEDFLKLALSSFHDSLLSAEQIRFVVEWFSMTSSYPEVNLIHYMTALEYLISQKGDKEEKIKRDVEDVLMKERIKSLIGKIDETEMINNKERSNVAKFVNERFPDTKKPSLRDNTIRLLNCWCISFEDIDLKGMVDARNDIVHDGFYKKDKDMLLNYVAAARDLIVQLVSVAIGYSGKYYSYLGGWHEAAIVRTVFVPTQSDLRLRTRKANGSDNTF